MKKLVLKTAFITLASILGAIILVSGIFLLFIPKPVASFFESMGNYSASMSFYEKQYNNTKSDQDLWNICLKVDEYGDSARAEKYLHKFATSSNFEKNCKTLDQSKSNGYSQTTEEFIEGKLVIAVYKNKGIDKAIDVATQCVAEDYTVYNPFYMLYSDPTINTNQEVLYKIRARLDLLMQASQPPIGGEAPEGTPGVGAPADDSDRVDLINQDIINLRDYFGIM